MRIKLSELVVYSCMMALSVLPLAFPVVVFGTNLTSRSDISVTDLTLDRSQDTPVLTATVVNNGNAIEGLPAFLKLYDRANNVSRTIELPEVHIPARQTVTLEVAWDQPWSGWGVIEASLELGRESLFAQAKTRFVYLPPEMATLSLASLLTLGGLAGRNLMTRMV